jgi:mono/diheme cytochrome c family protein/plastocyanin
MWGETIMSMRMKENLAVVSVLLILLGLPVAIFGYEKYHLLRSYPPGVKVFNVTAIAAGGIFTTERVAGYNYWWKQFQPAELVVNKGDEVVIRLTTPDVTHSFSLPRLGLGRVEVEPGHVREIRFRAEEAGEFNFWCDTICDMHHKFWCQPACRRIHQLMMGRLRVNGTPNPPPASIVERGRLNFLNLGCMRCHGPEGRGGIRNHNAKGGEVPALFKLADTIVNNRQEADRLLILLQRGGPLDEREVWLREFFKIKKTIREGKNPLKEDPNGPEPPLAMPAWGEKLSDKEIEELIAYIISLFPEEEWESWDEPIAKQRP